MAEVSCATGRGCLGDRLKLDQDGALDYRSAATRHGLVVLVDGVVVSRGQLPGRVQLAAWTGVPLEATVALPVMTESCCGSGKSGPSAGCC